jgi:DNA-binding GntR family transcriptional regulator
MTDRIDKRENLEKKSPLYIQFKDKLLQAIDRMSVVKNRLPKEMKLAEMMGVSRSTLREALNSLVLDKIVTKLSSKVMVAFPLVNKLTYRMENYADFRDMLVKSGTVRIEGAEPCLAEPSKRMLKRRDQVYT